MRWGGAPPGPRLSAPDTGTQTGPRARGAGKLGGAAGAHLRVRGLSGPRAPARPPAARPFRARGARVAGGADSLRCCSVSPCVRPAPGVDHSPPRSPSSLSGGRLGPRRRAEAGSGRRSSGGGRALRGARAEGCALLCPRGRELGPELAAAVAAAAPSAGPAPAGGSRAPRSAPRLLPAPAPPRQPAPGAPPGRDGASHLPPRPVRPLLLGTDSGTRVGSPPPRTPRTSTAHFARTLPGPPGAPKDSLGSSPGCSQRSCREPPAHIKPSHALYPPLGPPKEERTCHFWLTNPSHSLGPRSLDSTRQSHPSGEDGPRAAGLTRNAFQKENARPHHFWDRVLAELLR